MQSGDECARTPKVDRQLRVGQYHRIFATAVGKTSFRSAHRQLRHVPLQGDGRSTRCKAEVGNLDDVVAEAQEQAGKAKVAVADVMCVKVAQACEHMAAVAPRLCPLQAPPGRLPNHLEA